MRTETSLEAAYPWIKWREPVVVRSVDGDAYYACRFCIALVGLAGKNIPTLPTERSVVVAHIARAHPVISP